MLEGQRRAATRLSSPSSHIISSQSTGWEPVPYSSPPFNPTVERTAEILNTFTKHRHTGDNLHCLVVGDNTQASYPPFDIVDVLPNGVKRDWSKGGCTSIGRFGAGVRRAFGKRWFLEPNTSPPMSSFDMILEALSEAFGEVEDWEGGEGGNLRELIGSLRVMKLTRGDGVEFVDEEIVRGMVDDFIKRKQT